MTSSTAPSRLVADRSGVSQRRSPSTSTATSCQLSPCWLKPCRQVTTSMSDGKVTQAFAATFVEELVRCGLRDVCIAPGSRSAPLAMAFARNHEVRVWMQVDERCAGFFALGMAKTAGLPVAVLCTSGTAAAEMHPAVIEAHHSYTPLL